MITLTMAAALLTGCADGGAGEPGSDAPKDNGVAALAPNEVLQRATTAVKNAKSYHLKGNMDEDGEKMSLDLKVAGSDLGGRVTMGDSTVELLSVAGQQYIRPDEKFWVRTAGAKASGEITKLMGDKWAKVSDKDNDFVELFGVANIDDLLKPDGTLTKGEAKEIDGVQTIGLVDDGAKGGTLYVATTGEPYPIRVEGGQDVPGQITFSEFGATFDDVKAPPADQVVDFDQLKRK